MNIFTKGVQRSISLLSICGLLIGFMMLSSIGLKAQTKTIRGTVVDEKGMPLTGAVVSIVGTKTGVMADLDGKFEISLPKGKQMLQFSFMGYKTKKIKAKSGMKVKLMPDSQKLQEVVVTGMVAQDKRLFTGASDNLKADKIKMDGVADVSRGLEGRSAGVSVQNVSGTFGTAPKINVRGATSIYGSSTPLWVVDGVIQENVVNVGADALSSGDATTLISSAIAGLNADDIESFQILKDGSATSIYGAKAMAGVIVITTKKGRKGSSSFSYTGEFTTRLIPSYKTFNIMNSQEQMDLYQEIANKGWLNFADVHNAPTSGVYGRMYHLIHSYDVKKGQFGLANTPEAKAEFLQNAAMRNTNWFDELFSMGIMQNHAISMSTGTEKSRSYISLSAMLDPGWTMASKVRRYTANLNNTYDITPKISLTTIASASYRNQEAPGTLGQDFDVVNGGVSRSFDINPFAYALTTSRTLDANQDYQRSYAPFNIKRELQNNNINLDVLNLKFQGELKWRPLRGLSLSVLGAVKYDVTNQEHRVTEYSNQALAYRAMDNSTIIDRNKWLYTDQDKPNSLPITVLPKGGFYNTNTYKMLAYDFRASATYNTEFEGGHILNTFAGFELNAQDRQSNSAKGWGMQYDSGEAAFWDYHAFKQMLEQDDNYYYLSTYYNRSNAMFGMLTYSYQGKYTLNGTIRYEGSNQMGRSRKARWLPTWNISGAWNAHEEAFFQKYLSKAMSHLTLKASYSLTAAGLRGLNNSHVVIRSGTPWRPSANLREPSNYISDYENSELTYEKKHELNVGVDMGFLKNRISLTADAYQRNGFDLIGAINTVVGTRYGNVASMKSHGYELSLSTKNILRKNFSWTTDFIFGYTKTEITDLKTKNKMYQFVRSTGSFRQGYPQRSLFSIPFDGLDDKGFPTFLIDGKKVDYHNYSDINFQEREKLDYLKYEGSIAPTFNGSLGNIITWGDFRLNVFVTYSGGNKIRLAPNFSAYYSDLDASAKDWNNRWSVPGDELKEGVVPTIVARTDHMHYNDLGRAYNAYNFSSARVADGSFVRLKEVSLTYNMPKKLLGNGKLIKKASLKLQGTNLWLIYADSKLRGEDPEFARVGGVSTPIAKQITATLRIGF